MQVEQQEAQALRYDPKSAKAQEFIHDGEIRASIEEAKRLQDDGAQALRILERATDCKGMSHREAAFFLLAAARNK